MNAFPLLLLFNKKAFVLCLFQSSIQITFDSGLQVTASSAIESVTCTDRSAQRVVGNLCGSW